MLVKLRIELEVEAASPGDVLYVIDTLLDNGVPQDSINENECGVGEMRVKSAVVRMEEA